MLRHQDVVERPLGLLGPALQTRRLGRDLGQPARREVPPPPRGAGLAQTLEDAVHDQIRIAPDRRREMRVVGESEAEVVGPDFGIARELHRAEDVPRDDPLLGPPAEPVQKLLEPRRHRAPGLPAGAQGRERLLDLFDIRAIGGLVNAIDRGDTLRRQMARDRLVGREHELLDEAVRGGALVRAQRRGKRPLPGAELDLGQIEIERAAGNPDLGQPAGERRDRAEEPRHPLPRAAPRLKAPAARHRLGGLLVRQPRGAPDHA